MIKLELQAERARKRFEGIEKRLKNPRNIMGIISAKAYRDVIDHFNTETDDKGKRWVRWSKRDPKTKKRTFTSVRPYGRGGTKMLQDTGTLRSSIQPKTEKDQAVVYTRNKYARHHQEGTGRMPKRKFLYASSTLLKEVSILFKGFIIGK